MAPFRPTHAEVSLAALDSNFFYLKNLAGADTWFCPMVKANAYGHGAEVIGLHLERLGASALGVAMVEEGLALRQAGVGLPILVFGFFSAAAARACVAEGLTPVLARREDLEFFTAAAPPAFAVHIKFNTGMNRLGFAAERANQLAAEIRQGGRLRVAGVCSHLAQGEDWEVEGGSASRQVALLKAAAQAFPEAEVVHFLNSAALVKQSGAAPFGVRPGIALYGAGNFAGVRPVMSLHSEIALIHPVRRGQGVSYNFRWQAPRDSLIGVIPVGYADGLFRNLTNRTAALVRGQRVPLVGTICMDYTMADLTELAGGLPRVGERVTFWGEQDGQVLPADWVAGQAGTIAYELFTAVSARVPRRYREAD